MTFIGNPVDDEGNPIQRNFNSSAHLADWNNDGKLDFIAGGFDEETPSGGIFEVHLNVHADPNGMLWDADAIDLTSFYNEWRTTHEFVDLNGDNLPDLILGTEMGQALLAPNTGELGNPQFSSYSLLYSQAGPIDVYNHIDGGGRARENVADYNSDGIPDLIVGCNNGFLFVFIGYELE